MHIAFRWALVILLALGGASLTGFARADVSCPPVNTNTCTNAQDGDNESATDQGGTSASGDAVAGQVTGVVSSGDASVDATNHSEDVDVSSGDTTATNDVGTITGPVDGIPTVIVADVSVNMASNAQDGDNSSDVAQASDATSGDGVGGQVIGVVTSSGGTADVVAANTSEDVDIETGDADSANALGAEIGQLNGSPFIDVADVDAGLVFNAQDGDNDLSADQSATASSGDGVGGQVLGIVSAGDASVDATNRSEDIDAETGDASADNDTASLVGQVVGISTIAVADVTVNSAENAQDGDNAQELSQDALASTGDAVGGQVAGVVTSAGGTADVVAANTSDDVDVSTGDGDAANDIGAVTGQFDIVRIDTADVVAEESENVQDGDNETNADQTAAATSGDGVGGQVLGVVSAGDASVDATNASEDVDLETGDGDATNSFAAFVGQAQDELLIGPEANDVEVGTSTNAQDGDNSKELSQNALASTGDAVGGQVAGVVTSAGGSADLVLANTSEDVDGETGDSTIDNSDVEIVGQVSGEVDI